ncbi:PREDICTED: neuroblastoma-amplified sequence-like isoform X2 [Priapulus caudatus]|uniref:Neuroblastoma-amplified sequence-like isoform X2 n=1 Tax=Priapulus caudatus TaxID=37621 RepID=A0ABM1ENC4_PRICU|nr:PREDICTED: neuroblastoma-amplified sequence-like isoform X2 [Priapulus caudatus]
MAQPVKHQHQETLETYDDEETVLYELLEHTEWQQEWHETARPPRLSSTPAYSTSTQSAWSYLKSFVYPLKSAIGWSRPSGLAELINSRLHWKFAVSGDGKLTAILQENCIEIRSSKDDFANMLRKWQVPVDPQPQWRQMVWNSDSSLLAYGDSSGGVRVFDIIGTRICSISQNAGAAAAGIVDCSEAAAELIFLERERDAKWAAELLFISYNGQLTSYYIRTGEEGYQQHHSFSFKDTYPQGVGAVCYDKQHRLLIVGGCCQDNAGVDGLSEAMSKGITAWRVLADYPHYKQVTQLSEDVETVRQGKGFLRRITDMRFFIRQTEPDFVYRMLLSPECYRLATVHRSGMLSIWQVPSLRLDKSWSLEDQPGYDEERPLSIGLYNKATKKTPKEDQNINLPVDVSWWSEEAVILARLSGSVTVSSRKTLHNLLGQSCEWFNSSPQLSHVCDGALLTLECENTVAPKKRRLVSGDGQFMEHHEPFIDVEEEEEDEDSIGIVRRTTSCMKHALYAVTDMESFRPPRKRPKLMNRTYRLMCLKSTTPEELYARKIDDEEYGEALALAKAYGMDCDLVYQCQWRKSNASLAAIQDYLTKISKQSWVLHECLERVPDDVDAARELLMHGLRGTDLEALISIGCGKDYGRFISTTDEYYEDLDPYDEDDAKVIEERRQAKRKNLLSKVNFDRLTLQQIQLCQSRQKLLRYLDRLTTYEILLGGASVADEHFDYKEFKELREKNIVELAVGYAQCGRVHSVETLLMHHGDDLLPHWLPILSNFPEIVPPSNYECLLPKIQSDGTVEPWGMETLREKDWCEVEPCSSAINPTVPNLGGFLYEDVPELLQFKLELTPEGVVHMSTDQLSMWYRFRSLEIERLSCRVDNATDMVRLGIFHNVKGLEALADDLTTVEVLVYEGEVGDCVTLEHYQSLTNIEQLQLLMSRSSEEMYEKNVHLWILPFLDRCVKRSPDSAGKLLREYVVNMAKTDLSRCLKIFQMSKPEVSKPVITNTDTLMSLGLECLYMCERSDQLDLAHAIYECLPQRGSGLASDDSAALFNQVNALVDHLKAAKILETHGLPTPLHFIRQTESDAEDAKQLLVKLTRTAARRAPPLTEVEWKHLLNSMLELQRCVYRCLRAEHCYAIFCESLLGSERVENIRLAGDMMETCSNDPLAPFKKVVYDKAVDIVVRSAQEYFNSAANLMDGSMELARRCLQLITDTPAAVQTELDLIAALALLDDFGVSALPVEVRLQRERFSLVARAATSRPDAYASATSLLRLARLLRACGGDGREQRGRVLVMLAGAALARRDHAGAAAFCCDVVVDGYAAGWETCEALARCDEFDDVASRRLLADFALVHCTPDKLGSLLKSRALLEMQSLNRVLGQGEREGSHEPGDRRGSRSRESSPATNRANTASEDSMQADEKQKSDMYTAVRAFEQTKDLTKHVLASTTHTTKQVLSSTTSTTRALLGRMKEKKWWNQPRRWLRHKRNEAVEDEWLENQDLVQQGCHPFYSSVMPKALSSKVLMNYDGCSLAEHSNSSVELSMLLLRAAKLEEALNHGEAAQPATEAILNLAQEMLPHDTTLGLAYLLVLAQPTDADQCFEKLPSKVLPLQLASYYYALLICSIDAPTPEYIQQLFLNNPADVIKQAKSVNDVGRGASLLVRLQHYDKVLTDYMQAKVLQGLRKGVDVVRFAQDAEYKRETILGLSMSLEPEVYDVAVSLAESYNVPLWEVYMCHLEFLFTESGMTTPEVEAQLERLDILPQLQSEPAVLWERMRTYVYPSIHGTDHARLLYYYSTLQACGEHGRDGDMPAAEHIRLLRKIKPAAPGLNYKSLVSGASSSLDAIDSVLTANNVHVLAKLAPKLPSLDGKAPLTPSAVFSRWAVKLFRVDGKAEQLKAPQKTQADWIHRYEMSGEFVSRLLPEDLLSFIGSVVFIPTSMKNMNMATRQEIIRRALKHSRQQYAKSQTADGKNEKWKVCEETLEQWLGHLNMVYTDFIETTKASGTPFLQECAQEFDLSRGEEDNLKSLVYKLLEHGTSLDEVGKFLQVST